MNQGVHQLFWIERPPAKEFFQILLSVGAVKQLGQPRSCDADDELDSWLEGMQSAPCPDPVLGGCFLGAPPQTHDDVLEAFAIPHDRNLVGVVSLGYPVPHARNGSLKPGLVGWT